MAGLDGMKVSSKISIIFYLLIDLIDEIVQFLGITGRKR